jgi:hypothetical protein
MTNAIFLFDNQAATGSITASSEASALLAGENVIDPQRSVVWRSAAATSAYLNIILGAVYGVDTVALWDLNMTTAGTIRVQSWFDSIGGAVPGVDITVTPSLYVNTDLVTSAYGQGNYGIGLYGLNAPLSQDNNRNITIIPLASATTDSYWRITLEDINLSYIQAGGLFLGSSSTFEVNMGYGWTGDFIERNVSREAISGKRYSQPRDNRKRIAGAFGMLSDEERTSMLMRMRDYGNNRPFVFSVYPESTNQGLTTTLYGRFNSAQISGTTYARNQLSFNVVEEL